MLQVQNISKNNRNHSWSMPTCGFIGNNGSYAVKPDYSGCVINLYDLK